MTPNLMRYPTTSGIASSSLRGRVRERCLPVADAVCYGDAARRGSHRNAPSTGETLMDRDAQHPRPTGTVSRRRFLGAVGTMAGVAALAPTAARAQAPAGRPADPASTV